MLDVEAVPARRPAAATSSFHSGVEPTEVSRARRAAASSNARAIASSSVP